MWRWLGIAVLCCSLLNGEEWLHRDWRQVAVIPLNGTLHHVQGIDVNGGALWVSSVDRKSAKGWLTRFALPSGKLLNQVEVQQGRRIHPGGIALDGTWVWVPVAEYGRDGPSQIERRDRETLALVSRFEVNDHIGCLAVNEEGVLVAGNWDSRTLYRFNREGKELGRLTNPHPTAYQDLKFVAGALLGSGNLSRELGAIEWLDASDGRLLRRVLAGKTDRGVLFTNEGMTLRGGRLYLLPEDDPSRLFVFEQRD